MRVEVLTLYAFSSENWRRSEEEITDLTGLMASISSANWTTLQKEGVRLRLIGDHSAFGPDWSNGSNARSSGPPATSRLTLVVALNYGSRAEIAEAARKLARQSVRRRDRPGSDRRSGAWQRSCRPHGLPELDLLIRTSGEMRLSNFLLWQAAYAELLFVDDAVARFRRGGLRRSARANLRRAQRRFGGR